MASSVAINLRREIKEESKIIECLLRESHLMAEKGFCSRSPNNLPSNNIKHIDRELETSENPINRLNLSTPISHSGSDVPVCSMKIMQMN